MLDKDTPIGQVMYASTLQNKGLGGGSYGQQICNATEGIYENKHDRELFSSIGLDHYKQFFTENGFYIHHSGLKDREEVALKTQGYEKNEKHWGENPQEAPCSVIVQGDPGGPTYVTRSFHVGTDFAGRGNTMVHTFIFPQGTTYEDIKDIIDSLPFPDDIDKIITTGKQDPLKSFTINDLEKEVSKNNEQEEKAKPEKEQSQQPEPQPAPEPQPKPEKTQPEPEIPQPPQPQPAPAPKPQPAPAPTHEGTYDKWAENIKDEIVLPVCEDTDISYYIAFNILDKELCKTQDELRQKLKTGEISAEEFHKKYDALDKQRPIEKMETIEKQNKGNKEFYKEYDSAMDAYNKEQQQNASQSAQSTPEKPQTQPSITPPPVPEWAKPQPEKEALVFGEESGTPTKPTPKNPDPRQSAKQDIATELLYAQVYENNLKLSDKLTPQAAKFLQQYERALGALHIAIDNSKPPMTQEQINSRYERIKQIRDERIQGDHKLKCPVDEKCTKIESDAFFLGKDGKRTSFEQGLADRGFPPGREGMMQFAQQRAAKFCKKEFAQEKQQPEQQQSNGSWSSWLKGVTRPVAEWGEKLSQSIPPVVLSAATAITQGVTTVATAVYENFKPDQSADQREI